MPAVTTAEVIDGLAGKALGGKTRPGNDDLAVLVAISGVCGLVSGHAFSIVNGCATWSYIRGSEGPQIRGSFDRAFRDEAAKGFAQGDLLQR